jgi:opacity protein-like surface antigen
MKKMLLIAVLGLSVPAYAAESDGEASGGGVSGGVGMYVGIGTSFVGGGERVDYNDAAGYSETEMNTHPTSIGGTFLLGVQKILPSHPVCIGAEIGVDVGPQRHEASPGRVDNYHLGDYYDLSTFRNGTTPFVGLRIGYIDHEHKFITYVRVGASHCKSRENFKRWHDEEGEDNELTADVKINSSSVMPTFALGLEKSLGKDLTARFETEYRLSKKKTQAYSDGTKVELYQKGTFSVRGLVCYNVKCF